MYRFPHLIVQRCGKISAWLSETVLDYVMAPDPAPLVGSCLYPSVGNTAMLDGVTPTPISYTGGEKYFSQKKIQVMNGYLPGKFQT